MSLFKRIKNIIKSNIKCNEQEIDINAYKDIYFEDTNKIEETDPAKKYYKVLEVEYGADFKQIKSAYRKLLKKYHPDKFHNDKEKLKIAQEVTKQINEAYTYFERKAQ